MYCSCRMELFRGDVTASLPGAIRTWRAPVLVGLIASALGAWLILPVVISGPSMYPTLLPGDRLLTTRSVAVPIGRGDLIVFRPAVGPEDYVVKRVIGIPGDRVRIIDYGVWVNGRRLYEPYLKQPWTQGETYAGGGELTLTKDEYFLMGDNRDRSLDSRVLGPQRRNRIVGRAFFRAWPIPRTGGWLD